ncbi:MAG: GPW/gp25 family protein [Pyrinomonadaceae bacterium MAG19_C2-C3]|nr:GPW/gp25 family protein [Pyrinomonadaceae bacterium MAG19_C2-C3]
MLIRSSALSFPLRPDGRGSLAVVTDVDAQVAESLIDLLEVRRGERVMMPDYGIDDFVFETIDAGFAKRFAYLVTEQIRRYEPRIVDVRVTGGTLDGDDFQNGLTSDIHRAALKITYLTATSLAPNTLIYPLWRLRDEYAIDYPIYAAPVAEVEMVDGLDFNFFDNSQHLATIGL